MNMGLGLAYLYHTFRRYLSVALGKEFTRPFALHLTLTDKCNLRCQMCPAWKQDHKADLSLDEYKRIITRAARYGVHLITLGGTEPLLRKDIFEIIEHAQKCRLITSLVTNGTLVNNALAEKLISAGLFRIGISLDGARAETHDQIRGVQGAFERTMNGLKYLSQAKKNANSRTVVYINTAIMKNNIDEIIDIVKIADDLGIKFLCQAYLPFFAGDKGETPPPDKSLALIDNLKLVKRTRGVVINPTPHLNLIKKIFVSGSTAPIKCTIGFDILIIGAEGESWVCPHFSFSKENILGNIREAGIAGVWHSPQFTLARRHALNCTQRCTINCMLPVSHAYWFIYDELIKPTLRKLISGSGKNKNAKPLG